MSIMTRKNKVLARYGFEVLANSIAFRLGKRTVYLFTGARRPSRSLSF